MTIRSIAVRSAIVLLLASAAGCAKAPRQRPVEGGPVDTGQGTLTAARNYLQGRWTLESFEVFPPGKPPLTAKGQGTLTDDEFANLRVEIRTDEKTADLLRAAGIDVRDNAISTNGRTVIDMQNRSLTYVLEGDAPTIRGPLAMNRPRFWEVEADLLTLTTKDDNGKPLSVSRWRRMRTP